MLCTSVLLLSVRTFDHALSFFPRMAVSLSFYMYVKFNLSYYSTVARYIIETGFVFSCGFKVFFL